MSANAFTADSALAALRAPRPGAAPPPPLEQAAFDAAHAAVAAALPQGSDAVVAAAPAAWAAADSLWQGIRATPAFALGSPQAACRKGCGWCCHQPVGAAAVEILAMARALPEDAKQSLRAWQKGTPCAFLKDGACSVYDFRPLKCRSLWHVDVRACMAKYAGLPSLGAAPDPRFLPEPKMICEGALKGLALPLIRAGRDCPGVELMPGLQAIIDRPDAAREWWSGKDVFPAAARLAWFPRPPRKGKRR